MKKYISFLLVSVLILLSGCGINVIKVENTTADMQNTITDEEATTFSANTVITSTTANTTTLPDTTTCKTSTTGKAVSTDKSVSTKSGVTISTTPTAKPSKTTTTKKQNKTITCSIEIDCKTILNNLGNLRPEKKTFLPKDGYILRETTVSVAEGSTVFDVLTLVCKQNTCPEKCTYCRESGIQLEYVYTPGYDSVYVRGIHQIYEKDCGTQSGWMYFVNGISPSYGINKYTVKNGDKIEMRYSSTGFGEDL